MGKNKIAFYVSFLKIFPYDIKLRKNILAMSYSSETSPTFSQVLAIVPYTYQSFNELMNNEVL